MSSGFYRMSLSLRSQAEREPLVAALCNCRLFPRIRARLGKFLKAVGYSKEENFFVFSFEVARFPAALLGFILEQFGTHTISIAWRSAIAETTLIERDGCSDVR